MSENVNIQNDCSTVVPLSTAHASVGMSLETLTFLFENAFDLSSGCNTSVIHYLHDEKTQ